MARALLACCSPPSRWSRTFRRRRKKEPVRTTTTTEAWAAWAAWVAWVAWAAWTCDFTAACGFACPQAASGFGLNPEDIHHGKGKRGSLESPAARRSRGGRAAGGGREDGGRHSVARYGQAKTAARPRAGGRSWQAPRQRRACDAQRRQGRRSFVREICRQRHRSGRPRDQNSARNRYPSEDCDVRLIQPRSTRRITKKKQDFLFVLLRVLRGSILETSKHGETVTLHG